jgi:predicted negative regulator of RcsB-dependent stress response
LQAILSFIIKKIYNSTTKMAKTNPTPPQDDSAELPDFLNTEGTNIQDTLSRSEAFIKKNQKTLGIALGAAAVVFVAWYYYAKVYSPEQEKQAQAAIYQAEIYFGMDSTDLALKGKKGSFAGFEQVIEDFGGTKTGNLAHYYAGICNLRKGNYQKAIDQLENFDTKDLMVGSVAKGAMGEAYLELGKKDDALKAFEAAANHSKNELTTPYYLQRAGETAEAAAQYGDALKYYTRIKTDYRTTAEGNEIEKYIARAEAKLKK